MCGGIETGAKGAGRFGTQERGCAACVIVLAVKLKEQNIDRVLRTD